MSDLIKREDALAAIDAFERDFQQSWKVQFSADIKALPAIDPAAMREATLREAAWCFDDDVGHPSKARDAILAIQVTKQHVEPQSPAAIREAALQARIKELENSLAWYQMMDAMSSDHVVELTDKLEAAEAKLTKALEERDEYKAAAEICGKAARAMLAELEKTE